MLNHPDNFGFTPRAGLPQAPPRPCVVQPSRSQLTTACPIGGGKLVLDLQGPRPEPGQVLESGRAALNVPARLATIAGQGLSTHGHFRCRTGTAVVPVRVLGDIPRGVVVRAGFPGRAGFSFPASGMVRGSRSRTASPRLQHSTGQPRWSRRPGCPRRGLRHRRQPAFPGASDLGRRPGTRPGSRSRSVGCRCRCRLEPGQEEVRPRAVSRLQPMASTSRGAASFEAHLDGGRARLRCRRSAVGPRRRVVRVGWSDNLRAMDVVRKPVGIRLVPAPHRLFQHGDGIRVSDRETVRGPSGRRDAPA